MKKMNRRQIHTTRRKYADSDLPKLPIFERIRAVIRKILYRFGFVGRALPQRWPSKSQKQPYRPQNILSPIRSGFTDEDLPEIALL